MDTINKKKTLIWDILTIILGTVLCSLPLFLKGIDGQPYQDLQFHLSRIEGIKDGLKAGQFPVMLESNWLNGRGYPVGIFYGDLLLYLPALLRLVGIPVVAVYKIFVVLINLVTVLAAYICFGKIFKDRTAGAVSAILYVTASYRLVDVYVRAAVGEYVAFIFFPLIALAMYRILDKEKAGKRDIIKNSLLLTLGMTGLIESHILSTVMTCFILVVVCILCFKRTFRVSTLITIGLGALETLLINLYFLVPFLDYMINEPVYAGKGGDHTQALEIRSSGAYLSQLTDFFGGIFGRNIEDVSLRMQLTVGLPLMVALVAAFIWFVIKERKYHIFVLGALTVLTLWMSTNMFPWNSLEGYTHLFKLLSKVQFPWRYLAMAVTFICLLTGPVLVSIGLKKTWPKILGAAVLLGLTCVMTVVFTDRYRTDYYMVDYAGYDEVDSGYIGACEYLKEGTELFVAEYEPDNPELEEYEIVSEKDNTVVVRVSNPGKDSEMLIPRLHYKGFRAVTDDGTVIPTRDGYLNLVLFTVPAGYEGDITVEYKQPLVWRIAEIISLLSAVGVVILWRKNIKEA